MRARGAGTTRSVRALGLALLLVSLLLFVEMMRGGSLWRASYPHLPRRVKAIPYQLRAKLPGAHPTPVALPTPALLMEDEGSIDPIQPSLPKTPSPSPSPIPNPSPSATRFPLPVSAALTGLRHEYQTWNNCGPATMSMALGLVGDDLDQAVAARFLKPDPDDKNVSPDEMARFAAERGYGAVSRPGGDLDLMRQLVAMGLPVVVETWFIPDPGDEMGHYRVLTGFESDAVSGLLVIQAADSYLGPGIEIPASRFDEDWRAFNRQFIVVYPLERESEVEAALGERWVEADALALTAARSMTELDRAQDVWAWYNLGASLLAMDDPVAAAQAFDRARAIGLPWRLLWYRFEAFEAYAAVGRWTDVRSLAEANLRNAPNLEESHYWRGRALEAEGDEDAAQKAYQRALDLNPAFEPAKARVEER